jgi:putative photosynthetic complex assembly protein 2
MRQSAKLNLFLGVRNLSEEFLPEHLRYLESYFRKRPMNLLLPVSVTAATMLAALIWREALATHAKPFEIVGFTLVAMMLTLAILEHWFLVLPLPTTALWRWSLRSRKANRSQPPLPAHQHAPALVPPTARS